MLTFLSVTNWKKIVRNLRKNTKEKKVQNIFFSVRPFIFFSRGRVYTETQKQNTLGKK